MTLDEEWRPLFDGTYEASSLGRFRRAKPGMTTGVVGRILSQHTDKNSGYKLVGIRVDGRKKTFLAHVLIAATFKGPCPDGHEVNHIDRNRGNNSAENLEYLTHSANLLHSSESLSRSAGKLTESDVIEIRRRLSNGETQTAIASSFGVHKTNVSCIARNLTWRHLQ